MPLKETVLPKPRLLGFCLSLTDLGAGKCPIPVSSSHPVPPEAMEGNWKALVKFKVRKGHKLTKRQWPSYRIVKCFPLLYISPPNKGLFRHFLCPVHHVWLSKKKKSKHIKAENSLKRQQTSESDSHMAEMLELSDWKLKTIMINILKIVMNKVDSM